MTRLANIDRKTNETDISLGINIDGKGINNIDTGIGFLDHMLILFSKHGLFDLDIKANGDLHIDDHHTVEDIGIVLGQAIKTALGDKTSIKRYGNSYVPMDEALAFVCIDIGGRPYLVFDATFPQQKAGTMETDLVEEFFRAVSVNSGMNLHIKVLYGSNTHHMIEGIFKAFGRALCEATTLDSRIEGVMSTKGVI